MPCRIGIVEAAHLVVGDAQKRQGTPVAAAGIAGAFQRRNAVKGLTAGNMGTTDFQHGLGVLWLNRQYAFGGFGCAIILAHFAQSLCHLHAGHRVHRIDGVFLTPEDRAAERIGTFIGRARGSIGRQARGRGFGYG